MPKIFLIKNRLHQQQLRVLESQKHALEGDGNEPLSLVSRKREATGESPEYPLTRSCTSKVLCNTICAIAAYQIWLFDDTSAKIRSDYPELAEFSCWRRHFSRLNL